MQEGRWKVTWKLKTGCTRIQLCGTVDDLIEAVLEALEYPEHQMTIEDLERKQPNSEISDGDEPPLVSATQTNVNGSSPFAASNG